MFGYQYDLMRTVVVGRDPTPAQLRTIEASRHLMASCAQMLAEGVTPRALREGALAVAAAGGFDPGGDSTFGPAINAGWAEPYLQEPLDRPGMDDPIALPCAFAFETFLHDGHGNYAKWEDMYAWLPDGVERLTGADPGRDLAAPLLR